MMMMAIMIMMIIFTLQRVPSSYCRPTPVAYTTRCLNNKFDVYQHTEHEKSSSDVTLPTNTSTVQRKLVLQYCREGARHHDQIE